MICRAADGSVRDGLSLLDQAIAHGAGVVSEAQVRDMLGLADRARIFDLFDAVMRGNSAAALALLAEQYAVGADPSVVLQDMLELTHWLTRLKLTPDQADNSAVAETERVRGGALAKSLSMANLTRTWSMLLKGLAETRQAPQPLQSAEMVLIRLMFATDLPSPAEAIEALRQSGPAGAPGAVSGVTAAAPSSSGASAMVHPIAGGSGQTVMRVAVAPQPQGEQLPAPHSFQDVIALCAARREAVLSASLTSSVHLVHFEPGRIEFRPNDAAPGDLAPRLSRLLSEWTGRPWLVGVSREAGAQTLRDAGIERETQRKKDAASDPLVRAILTAFPGATIEAVRELTPGDGDREQALLAEPLDGDWTLGEEE
jgi:DNA polymerase-3 subunit gamma/tau